MPESELCEKHLRARSHFIALQFEFDCQYIRPSRNTTSKHKVRLLKLLFFAAIIDNKITRHVQHGSSSALVPEQTPSAFPPPLHHPRFPSSRRVQLL